MQQDDPWSLDAANKPARTELKVEPQAPTSLEDALLALDHKSAPVFAVLDGAQFDNLPQELLMGDFVSRPLYLDRGDNNPEQIITAPHMVWLDEHPEKITGRAPKDTIPALMALIAGRPAAVFWQCPDGADALYKHLRGINVVMYPKAALTIYEQQFVAENEIAVLYRHADANVIAQSIFALSPANQTRVLGPASALLCSPENIWFADTLISLTGPTRDRRPGGLMHLTIQEAQSIAAANREGAARLISAELKQTSALSLEALERQVHAAVIRAEQYEIGQLEDLHTFVTLDLLMGAGFETKPQFAEALEELCDLEKPPDARIHYAKQACNRAET
ncbi:DUF4123 domain-containing protein [Paracoccus lutimaris]|uniref:Uncharacterized protein DUF4123 n=1 Tax=Paracoccus lutimaris TaxID=1490030 RepID=A0A368YI20_9RHOB|nr:DUF4123 domain-containing protein [Paracoccus lutimaris]RCW79890.1 uncharacterized protein DUF4123 [Paracoccus lutimaris]